MIFSFWILLFPSLSFPRAFPFPLPLVLIYKTSLFISESFLFATSSISYLLSCRSFFSPQFIHFSNYPLSNDIKQPSSANTVHHYNLIIAVVITPRVPVLSAFPHLFFFFYSLIFLLYSTFKRLSAPHMLASLLEGLQCQL